MSDRIILKINADGSIEILGSYEDSDAGNKKFDLLIKSLEQDTWKNVISSSNKYVNSYTISECVEEWLNTKTNIKLALFRTNRISYATTYSFMRND